MKNIIRTILNALEERAIQEYKSRHPERYYRHGHQPRSRKFITSFGPIHYRLAQLLDRQTERVFPPLVEGLSILPYKQYQREALEAAPKALDPSHLLYSVTGSEKGISFETDTMGSITVIGGRSSP
ncbi:MAG: hypothetical protein J7L72_01290, partial [Candidatus Aminicenantes bacterium]|nr:hypothetical protein [Candidatus Aminicenantes bacterium]